MIKAREKFIFAVSLFFVTYIGVYINTHMFMQNDDWVYYKTVERFMSSNFTLDPEVGTTFFAQGILGFLFSLVFGLSKLPLLTFLISIGNFVILFFIFRQRLKIEKPLSLFFSLMIFLTPLHIYLSIGFMVENYLLFFTLLAFYFYLAYKDKQKLTYLVTAILFAVLSFFVKQLGIVTLGVFFIDQLFTKKLGREALVTAGSLLLTVTFYYLLFPKTQVMQRQNLHFSNIFDIKSVLNFVSSSIVYITAFTLPVPVYFVYRKLRLKRSKHPIKLLLSTIIPVVIVISVIFLGGRDFPYFGNTFTRKGFFPGGLAGNKYHFSGFYDLFNLWGYISLLVTIVFTAVYFYTLKKRIPNVFETYIASYVSACFILPYFYDRYYVLLIPMAVLALVKNLERFDKFLRIVVIGFSIFLAVSAYQYLSDYIGWNSYVWDRAENLSKETGIFRNQIIASRAWNKYYKTETSNAEYLFSFDSPEVLQDPKKKTLEAKTITFPLSAWIKPVVYLYELQ